MSTLIERGLRSAAEDLGLSPDGWSPIEGYPGTGHAFRHCDKPSLVVEVSTDEHSWSWTAGNSGSGPRLKAPPAVTQRWACVHGLLVRDCADARAALLDALTIAGDDLEEARACSTIMLHTRLETLTCRRGVDVFVAPIEHVGTSTEEPAQPLRLTWDYRGAVPNGDDVAGEVVAADEMTAQELAQQRHPGLDLISLEPRLAGLRSLPVTPARIALERSLISPRVSRDVPIAVPA
ncbi:hypothetical protein D9599_15475 [Roseomonas sp. KE2513]|uniref:hypothetical protein n=1 Tax=Roseomonas sp. KE2513 TaxID=2479202 RepID=UPI0018DFEC35|nr:hypothetical protein [Roseomonas sp. KE2513]MBI0536970.1 hypothetical protein [Roseomonas sp. KE2513]